MTKEKISSDLTPFLRLIPLFVMIGIIITTVYWLFHIESEVYNLIIMLVIFLAWAFYGYRGIKHVYKDDEYLYIESSKINTKLPISELEDARQIAYFAIRPIHLTFKNETVFGKRIKFIGRFEIDYKGTAHPTVTMLNKLIKTNANNI